MESPEQIYDQYYSEDGGLKIEAALSLFDTMGLPLELRNCVRDGTFNEWDNAGLPSWFMPYRDIGQWELEGAVKGRAMGMQTAKLIRSVACSLPLLGAWLRAGDLMLDSGVDPESSMIAYLARQWDTARLRAEQDAMDKIRKENPIQFLKRTDRDGEWDDHEARRLLKYKQELSKEIQDVPIQVEFNFGEPE